MNLSLTELIFICNVLYGNKVLSGVSRQIFFFTTSGSISRNVTHHFYESKVFNHSFYNFVRANSQKNINNSGQIYSTLKVINCSSEMNPKYSYLQKKFKLAVPLCSNRISGTSIVT